MPRKLPNRGDWSDSGPALSAMPAYIERNNADGQNPSLRAQGFLSKDTGWDDVTYWVFEKP
jgi:hypothetical protein